MSVQFIFFLFKSHGCLPYLCPQHKCIPYITHLDSPQYTFIILCSNYILLSLCMYENWTILVFLVETLVYVFFSPWEAAFKVYNMLWHPLCDLTEQQRVWIQHDLNYPLVCSVSCLCVTENKLREKISLFLF